MSDELSIEEWLSHGIGEEEEEIKSAVVNAGYAWRVRSRDGQPCVGTRDYRMDRVNADIVDGRVTDLRLG